MSSAQWRNSYEVDRNNNSNGFPERQGSPAIFISQLTLLRNPSHARYKETILCALLSRFPASLAKALKELQVKRYATELSDYPRVNMYFSLVILSLGLIQFPVEGSLSDQPSNDAIVANETTQDLNDHHQSKRSLPAKLKANNKHKEHPYSLILDPDSNYRLYWTPDYENRQIKFQVDISRLAAQSWFALGFSDRGDWPGADLCVAWENWKGARIIQDAHADAAGVLRPDGHGDCREGSFRRHSDGSASVEFIRSFDTCHGQDYLIEDGTVHVVYASGSGPLYRIDGVSPAKEDAGFQRTRLLKPSFDHNHSSPDDLRPLLISNAQLNVPASETTYYCRVVRLPEHFKRKHHILQFEAAINKGSESIVHHMEVFHCEAPPDTVIPEYRGECADPNRPEATRVCKRVLAAWAYGAEPFVYPPEAGLPIGGPDFSPYVMLEVHYNNPTLRGDWIDSSGIRMWYTSHLRKYDAGVMELGLEYTDKMALPPGIDSFTLSGFCIAECTAVSLPKSGITIFGSQLHTHLHGYKVVTQHFRDDSELPELNRDNHYSTHYQEIRLLADPVRVLPGDALVTTCFYDSTHTENVTLGGFSISDEMCVNYVHYFPRVDLEVCKSSISYDALRNYFKFMNEWEKQPTSPNAGISDNYKSIKWNRLRAVTLQDYYNKASISMQCNQSSGDRFPGNWEGLPKPEFPLPVSIVESTSQECSSDERGKHESKFKSNGNTLKDFDELEFPK
nr:EOG090X0318 [Moina brachiata]